MKSGERSSMSLYLCWHTGLSATSLWPGLSYTCLTVSWELRLRHGLKPFSVAGKTLCAQLGLPQCQACQAGWMSICPYPLLQWGAVPPHLVQLSHVRIIQFSPFQQQYCEILFGWGLHSLNKWAIAATFLVSKECLEYVPFTGSVKNSSFLTHPCVKSGVLVARSIQVLHVLPMSPLPSVVLQWICFQKMLKGL